MGLTRPTPRLRECGFYVLQFDCPYDSIFRNQISRNLFWPFHYKSKGHISRNLHQWTEP